MARTKIGIIGAGKSPRATHRLHMCDELIDGDLGALVES